MDYLSRKPSLFTFSTVHKQFPFSGCQNDFGGPCSRPELLYAYLLNIEESDLKNGHQLWMQLKTAQS